MFRWTRVRPWHYGYNYLFYGQINVFRLQRADNNYYSTLDWTRFVCVIIKEQQCLHNSDLILPLTWLKWHTKIMTSVKYYCLFTSKCFTVRTCSTSSTSKIIILVCRTKKLIITENRSLIIVIYIICEWDFTIKYFSSLAISSVNMYSNYIYLHSLAYFAGFVSIRMIIVSFRLQNER